MIEKWACSSKSDLSKGTDSIARPCPFFMGCRTCRRLIELWERIEAAQQQQNEGRNGDGRRAVWNYLTLKIAKAIAAGQPTVALKRGEGVGVRWGQLDECYSPENTANYYRRLRELTEQFPVLGFVPASGGDFEDGKDVLKSRADDMIKNAQFMTNRANDLRVLVDLNPVGQPMLHEAFDDFKKSVEQELRRTDSEGVTTLSSWGHALLRYVDRFKERHDDIPVGSISPKVLESMFRLWRLRPHVKGTSRPMAVETVKEHMKQLRRFFRWLHQSDDYEWKKTLNFDDLRSTVDETDEEIAARARTIQVATFSVDELALLNRYATPIERVLLLLGLNAGFKPSEMGTLTISEVHLHRLHPMAETIEIDRNKFYTEMTANDSFILRIRRKSKVYGEHILFAQTVEALKWAIERRKAITVVTRGVEKGKEIPVAAHSKLLVSEHGVPYINPTAGHNNSQRIQNLWKALIRRVKKHHPDFNGLPVSALRDTAANFIRQRYGGEVMAVFLNHGKPVQSDVFAENYSNRPWGRVFDALREYEGHLAPMFEAAPADPFPRFVKTQQINGKSTKSRKKKSKTKAQRRAEKIIQLKRAGRSVVEIMEELNVSHAVVTRHLTNAALKKRKPKKVRSDTVIGVHSDTGPQFSDTNGCENRTQANFGSLNRD